VQAEFFEDPISSFSSCEFVRVQREVIVFTGARPMIRNPEYKKLLTLLGGHTDIIDTYSGVNDINASYILFSAFCYRKGTRLPVVQSLRCILFSLDDEVPKTE
jgi:hypothetical protein